MKKDIISFLILFVLGILIYMGGLTTGASIENREWQQWCIKNHHGGFDKTTGEFKRYNIEDEIENLLKDFPFLRDEQPDYSKPIIEGTI